MPLLQPPDASRGKLVHLVLPFSFFKNTLVSFKRDALTDFFTLGIGIETYFAQLVSLASQHGQSGLLGRGIPGRHGLLRLPSKA